MPKAKDLKKGKIGTVEEFMELFRDEWVLMEVIEVNELEEPSVGRLIAHSPKRSVIMKELRGTTQKDMAVFFMGDMPVKGTLFMI